MSEKNIYEFVAIQDIIIDHIYTKNITDYKNYAEKVTEKILNNKLISELQIKTELKKFKHMFYRFNDINKNDFINDFPYDDIICRLKNMNYTKSFYNNRSKPLMKVTDIFPEIKNVDINFAEKMTYKLDIEERIIQDGLRKSLKEKGASNIIPRKSDTSLEVADLEDFTMLINGNEHSFTSVVKGYRSVNTLKINFKSISHQILKANNTNPDYILLVIAKSLVDGVITQLVKYSIDVGNRNLIVIIDPIDLTRFLLFNKII